MNKELEEIKKKLEELKEYKTTYYGSQWFKVEVCADEEMKSLIDKVLNYIDNSISKEVIDKERIKQRTKLLYCNRAKNKAILDNNKEEIERQERLINILKVNIKSLEDILYERVNT